MASKSFFHRLHRRWKRLWLKPIHVFLFHHVSEEYNPLIAAKSDWTSTEQFKKNINQLQKDFGFISLEKAWKRLNHDRFRLRKYAVLTADDGYRSILEVLPWLERQGVPITIFVNTKYLDKKSWGEVNEEVAKEFDPNVDMLSEVCPDLFMSQDELFALDSPMISIGLHGHEHLEATKQSEKEFRDNVEICKQIISKHSGFVPFFAFPWGNHDEMTDRIVREMNLVPVLVNGMKNDNKTECINRFCIDGKHI